MKKIFIVLVLCFMLASCEGNEQVNECNSGEVLVDGECSKELTCEISQELIEGECVDIDPVCEVDEELVEGECKIIDPVCNDNQVLDNDQCVDPPKPVITLLGEVEIWIEAGFEYVDPGVNALYNNEAVEVEITEKPNIEVLGTYTVKYNVTVNEKHADEVLRTVHVVDTTAPVISFRTEDFTVEIGNEYYFRDVIVTDNYDNDEDIELVITEEIDVNVLGDYEVSYYAVDTQGNQSDTITKTISVINPVELDFTERFLKDNTVFYDPKPYPNSYTFNVIEWVHKGVKYENGNYTPVLYFFLHNDIDDKKVLKKIEFVCSRGGNQVHELDDGIIDYAFEIPLNCVENGQIGIITYAHDEYEPGQYWVAAMAVSSSCLDVDKILSANLKKGNHS